MFLGPNMTSEKMRISLAMVPVTSIAFDHATGLMRALWGGRIRYHTYFIDEGKWPREINLFD